MLERDGNYRIDWILLRGRNIATSSIIDYRHDNGLLPSDHYPVVAHTSNKRRADSALVLSYDGGVRASWVRLRRPMDFTLQSGMPGSRVLPLQAVGRGRGGARLLDDDRSGAHAGSLGGSAGRLGAAARDRRLFRRSADLRLAQVDHVLAEILLLLRAPEEELPRGLRVPWPRAEGPPGAARRSGVEVQGRSHHPRQAPGRSRGAGHRLAAGSVRTVRRAGLEDRRAARRVETEAEAETGAEAEPEER